MLQRWNAGGWALLVAVILGVLLVRLTPLLAQRRCWLGFKATILRWRRWEFWPPWLFYCPVAIHYVRLAVRYGGFTLPTAANPGIFSGGFVGESKIATLREMARTSPGFTAEAFLLPAVPYFSWGAGAASLDRFTFMEKIRAERNITMPFILKPDMGQRGVGVKLIRSLEQAAAYLRFTRASLVIQHYAPGPNEVGIFYYRFPGQPRGRIFAITEKIFPTVTGDGQSSLEELIWQDPRARIVAQKYLRRLAARRHAIPALGEVVKLVEAGNHAQGCIFQDGMHLWSEELENRIDEISQKLDGFYIGRYDVRYSSLDSLRQGKDFLIIELNGASAEATSIYDARHSLIQAYRTLFRQWELVFAIGAANRQRGWMPTRLSLLWRKWRENTALVATYPLAD